MDRLCRLPADGFLLQKANQAAEEDVDGDHRICRISDTEFASIAESIGSNWAAPAQPVSDGRNDLA